MAVVRVSVTRGAVGLDGQTVIHGIRASAPTGPLKLRPLTGEPINQRDAYRMVAQVTKATGIPRHISPHPARHASFTSAWDAGVPPRERMTDPP